jgi:hypothetical protein
MVEVASRKVLGIKFRSGQQQYLLFEVERGKTLLTALPPPRLMNNV